EIVHEIEEWNSAQVDAALVASWNAWLDWRRTSMADRARWMAGASDRLKEGAETYGKLISREMGKPIREARAEVAKCAWVCEHYATEAASDLAPEDIASDAGRSFVAFEPIGPVLAVMPWNFPFWQVFRFAAPALMAGNTGLLKHASNVPGCALAIEEVFRSAGFPENVFRTLPIGAAQVSRVIESAQVQAVTLTGSDAAGRKVAQKAGSRIKKTVLELGGSDPFIVLEDAEIPEAAKVGAAARCLNGGQSCIAAKRFIVVDAVYEPFLERFREEMAAWVVGDPLDEETQVGPLAGEAFLEDLRTQVKKSLKAGAKVALGGEALNRPGFFFPPTILTDVKPGMPVADEEVFGPVAAVIRVKDEEEALRTANDTKFGLGASVWTADSTRGERIASRIQAGAVFINGMVKSDPRLPFGGIKDSGYGRELGRFGIREFVNIKTVWIR
ncbi:MAG: NAD-dependent succinate-semialdehyde dehydrogenase, partial [Planctomycetota bacterium]